MSQELNKEVIKKIVDHVKPVIEDGTFTEAESSFNALMPEYGNGLTPEMVTLASDYLTFFAPHARAASGEVAVPAMSADPDLKSVSAKFSLGDFGNMSVQVNRLHESGLPNVNPVKGTSRVEIDFIAERRNGGLMKAAIAHVKAIAEESL